LAERVGFVPVVHCPINGLGRIETARNRQIHQKPEYQVQTRYGAIPIAPLVLNAGISSNLAGIIGADAALAVSTLRLFPYNPASLNAAAMA
jgi:hypothetical protein